MNKILKIKKKNYSNFVNLSWFKILTLRISTKIIFYQNKFLKNLTTNLNCPIWRNTSSLVLCNFVTKKKFIKFYKNFFNSPQTIHLHSFLLSPQSSLSNCLSIPRFHLTLTLLHCTVSRCLYLKSQVNCNVNKLKKFLCNFSFAVFHETDVRRRWMIFIAEKLISLDWAASN
jgi:hypothetical protein